MANTFERFIALFNTQPLVAITLVLVFALCIAIVWVLLFKAAPRYIKYKKQKGIWGDMSSADQKIFIRIWSELIEADGMTLEDEFDVLPFEVKPAQFKSAQEVSFDDAIDHSKNMSCEQREFLLEMCDVVSKSDGDIATSEQKVLKRINNSIPRG